MSLPPFVARLIGIGKYDEYPHLQPEGDTNAKSLEKFLRGDPTLNRDIDVKTIIENVTRDNIIEIFDELGNSIDRNKAILIFFSGYGGRTVAGRRLSIICPADIGASDKSKGITDQELVHYFDGISRFRGNNIVSVSSSTYEIEAETYIAHFRHFCWTVRHRNLNGEIPVLSL